MWRTILLVALGAVLGGAGLAFAQALSTAVVVSSVTYTAGEIRPMTLNTNGELRASCN